MNKVDHHIKQTKSISMLTRNRPFKEIAIDFVGELPESEGFNVILVITDQFTKVQHHIPVRTTWTTVDVADAYICYVWKLYGLLRHITSDHGPQFESLFAKELNKKLDIGLRLSTPYHSQTDGFSKWAIQI